MLHVELMTLPLPMKQQSLLHSQDSALRNVLGEFNHRDQLYTMDCQAYGTSRLSAQHTSPRSQLTQHTSEPKARGNDKHRGKSTMRKIGLNSLNGNTHQLAGSEVTDSTPHKAGDGQLCLLRLCVCLFGMCYYLCFIATNSTPAYGKIHHIN